MFYITTKLKYGEKCVSANIAACSVSGKTANNKFLADCFVSWISCKRKYVKMLGTFASGLYLCFLICDV